MKPYPPKVHIAILAFLLTTITHPQTIQSKISISIQRASLHLLQNLLFCSKACRQAFVQSSHPDMVQYYNNHSHDSKAASPIKTLMDILLQKYSQPKYTQVTNSIMDMIHQCSTKFDSFYPQFRVAHQYVSERNHLPNTFQGIQRSILSPTVHRPSMEESTNVSMKDLRMARDMALRYFEREVQRIHHWMEKTNLCFEILVPRIGYGVLETIGNDNHGINNRVKRKKGSSSVGIYTYDDQNDLNDNSSSDEESDALEIDWEDGDDMEDFPNLEGNSKNENDSNTDISISEKDEDMIHRHNVERTLQIMLGGGSGIGEIQNSTGTHVTNATGVDYSLEIDLHGPTALSNSRPLQIRNINTGKKESWKEAMCTGEEFDIAEVPEIPPINPTPESSNTTMINKIATTSATQTLQNSINQLHRHHLPRLRTWIQGLISADDMTSLNIHLKLSTSLHRLPFLIRKRRKLILDELLVCKSSLASILASAASLGILPQTEEERASLSNQGNQKRTNEIEATSTSTNSSKTKASRDTTGVSWRRLMTNRTPDKFSSKSIHKVKLQSSHPPMKNNNVNGRKAFNGRMKLKIKKYAI